MWDLIQEIFNGDILRSALSNKMTEFPSTVQMDAGLALERPDKKVTIRIANLALATARLKGQPEEIVIALIRLAHLHFRQGRYSQTQALAEEVLRDAPSDSPMRCDALRMLGNCAAELGDPTGAEIFYHQAVDLARQLDYHYALYKCLHSLATNIYWPRGQFDLCLAAGKEALVQARTLNLTEELWFPLSDIAWVYWSTGRRECAIQIANQMEKVVFPGSLGEGFYCCLRAGLMEPCDGYLEKFLPYYERARSIAEATGDPGLNVEVRLGLCRAYRGANDLSSSAAWAEDAVTVSVRMNYRQFQALALIERARTAIALGDKTRAEKDLRDAIDISEQLHSNFDSARASLYLAVLFSAQKKPDTNALWQRVLQLIVDNGYAYLIEQERSLVIPWIAEMLDSTDLMLSRTSLALFEVLVSVPPAPIQVKTFGQFVLQVGVNVVSKESLRKRRAGELLALLLSSPGYTLSAEQVIEAMCPQKESNAALDFYHHAISALRHLLESDLPDRRFPCRYLEVSEERVSLIVPPGSNIDFMEFELSVHNQEWEKSIALYQGEYLALFPYLEWTIALRQHYADLFEQALLALASERLSAGAVSESLGLASRALLHNPWQEQAALIGMRAAVKMDDRMTAIKLYQRLEKTIAKELGIAPHKELQHFYSEIRKLTKQK